MKAHSYLRVSGKGQIDGDGYPRQREAIEKYCAAKGIELVREFREDGISGTKEAIDRPALSEMILAIAANGVRTVIVERADRLARDLMVSELLLQEFRKLGVTVIAADSDTDLTVSDSDPTRTLIRQVLACVAQFDKSVTVQKLRAARDRIRKEKGKCEGEKHYGFYDDEKPHLKVIHELKSEGKSLNQICDFLDSQHVPSRKGTRWYPMVISRILKRSIPLPQSQTTEPCAGQPAECSSAD